MPVMFIQAIGGMFMVLVLVTNSLTTTSSAIEKINQKHQQQQEIIKEEVDELIEDYQTYEEQYIEWQIEENDGLENEEITEEILNDIKPNAVDEYVQNQVEHKHIPERVSNYMKKQLPNHIQKYIDNKINNGWTKTQDITWWYIKQTVHGDKFEWMK